MKFLPTAIIALLMIATPMAASAQSKNDNPSANNEAGTSPSSTQCRDADGQVHMKSPTAGKKGDASTGAHVGAPSGTKSGGAAGMTTGTAPSGSQSGNSRELAPC
jgi:hypothetical protein